METNTQNQFEDSFDEALSWVIDLYFEKKGKISDKEILEIAEKYDVDADKLLIEARYEFRMSEAMSKLDDEIEKIAKKHNISPPDLINRHILYWNESTDYFQTALEQTIQQLHEKGEVDDKEIQNIADEFGIEPQLFKKIVEDSFSDITY
jgi:hypothetical protein